MTASTRWTSSRASRSRVSAMLGEVFYAGAIASVVARGPEYEPSIPELLRRIPYLTIIALDLIVAFGVAFGAVFFLLPGLWLYGSWVLAATIADIDHVGVREALRRSNRLAKGHRPTIVVTLLGVTVFSQVLAELLREVVETLTHDELVIDWVAGRPRRAAWPALRTAGSRLRARTAGAQGIRGRHARPELAGPDEAVGAARLVLRPRSGSRRPGHRRSRSRRSRGHRRGAATREQGRR